MLALSKFTMIEQSRIYTIPNSFNESFAHLDTCIGDEKIKRKDYVALKSTDGLPSLQKKTADKMIKNLETAAKKFNYKAVEIYKLCDKPFYGFVLKKFMLKLGAGIIM